MTGRPSRRHGERDRAPASAPAQPTVPYLATVTPSAREIAETATTDLPLSALLAASREEARRHERERIARGLHDCVIQQVSSLQLRARALADHVDEPTGRPPEDPQAVRRTADEISALAATALADLRDLVVALGPTPEEATMALSAPALSTLTPRERDILALVARGWSNQQVADRLGIRERTARTHVSNVLAKLHLTSRTQAALVAVREGLVGLASLPGSDDEADAAGPQPRTAHPQARMPESARAPQPEPTPHPLTAAVPVRG